MFFEESIDYLAVFGMIADFSLFLTSDVYLKLNS
jgi:hypothetical protein